MNIKKKSLITSTAVILGLVMLGACSYVDWEDTRDDRVGTDREQCIDRTKIGDDSRCPDTRRPVCGCDGKTYANACIADKAGVTRYKAGACEN